MLQKELIKRLKGRYETKMDDKGWLNVSSDGIPLCRVKYNGNCIICRMNTVKKLRVYRMKC